MFIHTSNTIIYENSKAFLLYSEFRISEFYNFIFFTINIDKFAFVLIITKKTYLILKIDDVVSPVSNVHTLGAVIHHGH